MKRHHLTAIVVISLCLGMGCGVGEDPWTDAWEGGKAEEGLPRKEKDLFEALHHLLGTLQLERTSLLGGPEQGDSSYRVALTDGSDYSLASKDDVWATSLLIGGFTFNPALWHLIVTNVVGVAHTPWCFQFRGGCEKS